MDTQLSRRLWSLSIFLLHDLTPCTTVPSSKWIARRFNTGNPIACTLRPATTRFLHTTSICKARRRRALTSTTETESEGGDMFSTLSPSKGIDSLRSGFSEPDDADDDFRPVRGGRGVVASSQLKMGNKKKAFIAEDVFEQIFKGEDVIGKRRSGSLTMGGRSSQGLAPGTEWAASKAQQRDERVKLDGPEKEEMSREVYPFEKSGKVQEDRRTKRERDRELARSQLEGVYRLDVDDIDGKAIENEVAPDVSESATTTTRKERGTAQFTRASDVENVDDNISDDWYVGTAVNVPPELQVPQQSDEKAPPTEDFVPRWMQGIKVAEQRARSGTVAQEDEAERGSLLDDIPEDKYGEVTVEEVLRVLKEERGFNIAVIDLRNKADFAEFMVIVDGRSAKQIYSMADAVRRHMKHRISYRDPLMPTNLAIEGADCDDWMVLDLGRIILHCFTPEARVHYDLEGLWGSVVDPYKQTPTATQSEEASSSTTVENISMIPPQSRNQRGGDLSEEDANRIVEVIRQNWEREMQEEVAARKNLSLKQLTPEDFMGEEELIKRMKSPSWT
ncbi:Mitochondrial assembly of ribosomal large subunit protein 1 [Quaeritorhiza haematococci]|nr:Mitochondrial assembly of ribosomal large subunit protein 1 [Quaeritorhiza haematococci]